MARALFISRFGPPEVLAVRDIADPVPGPGQVTVRIKACGLNFSEVMARQGLYPDAPKPPCVVGYEASGVVQARGEGVHALEVGQRVCLAMRFGAHADLVCVAQEQAVPIPDAMTFEEAAALPVNYVTAYYMLFEVAHLKPRERILLHMAAGGVGTAVLQLCKTVPEVQVFGTASASKHAYLRAQGCACPIDYHSVDYASEVRRRVGAVDVVLDPLGGKEWRRGYELLAPGGRLVAFGFSRMATSERRRLWHVVWEYLTQPRFTGMELMNANRSISGVHMGRLWDKTEMMRMMLGRIMDLYREGVLRPHIDSVHPFTQAAQAHRRIEQRLNTGKVILVPD